MNNQNANDTLNQQKAAQQFAENLSKYPIEEQIVVGAISKNVINGCSWEFKRMDQELRQNFDAIKNNPNCDIKRVTYSKKSGIYGYLVYMNFTYLCNLLNTSAPGLIDAATLKEASQHRQEAIVSLASKMQSRKIKGLIGIYCTNDSQTITVQGKVYPAYAISLKELLQVCTRCNYGVVMNGAVRTPNQILQREDFVMENLLVAPSSNAMFIEVAPLG